jgi:hypothetical protein
MIHQGWAWRPVSHRILSPVVRQEQSIRISEVDGTREQAFFFFAKVIQRACYLGLVAPVGCIFSSVSFPLLTTDCFAGLNPQGNMKSRRAYGPTTRVEETVCSESALHIAYGGLKARPALAAAVDCQTDSWVMTCGNSYGVEDTFRVFSRLSLDRSVHSPGTVETDDFGSHRRIRRFSSPPMTSGVPDPVGDVYILT